MAPKKSGSGLSKKYGPLSLGAWFGVGGATALVWYIYQKRKASQAAAGLGLSGGTTIPAGQPGGGTTGLPSFSSLAAWEEAAISAMAGSTLSPADALNGLTDWINGQCVSQAQFQGISSIISSIGLPPGFSTMPVLSVCGSPTTANPTPPAPTPAAPAPPPLPGAGPPPTLAPSVIAAMTQNGEHVVDAAWDPAYQDWVYLTNKGGIYNQAQQGGQAAGGFFGSIFSLPQGPQGPHAGWYGWYGEPLRQATKITVNPDGGYSIVDTAGETYTFGPQPFENFATAHG